jgi:hypothetical protein
MALRAPGTWGMMISREPTVIATGGALAYVYDGHARITGCPTVLVIVCGGVTTTVDQLQSWAAQLT